MLVHIAKFIKLAFCGICDLRRGIRSCSPPMYTDLTAYTWVLRIVPYERTDQLLADRAERVIGPTERRLATGKGLP
jgi:hypothetical protein